MKINGKIYRVLYKILIAVVGLVVVGVIAFLVMQISGRNRLYGKDGRKGPNLSAFAETGASKPEAGATGAQEPEETAQAEDWREGDVRYKGSIYRYNEDILTFLFLGIDKQGEVKTAKNGLDGGQSDAIFLMVLNPRSQEISIIGINRDTMTDIDIYDEGGSYLSTKTAQLTLQHGYGDGGKLSCERSMEAVSRLFYDLPIHGYCAINMGAIPLINDAVGGVELTALENVPNTGIKKGQTVHLMGKNAYYYLHNRDTGIFNSAGGRLERQKQYLSAYAARVMDEMKKDITLPVKLYSTLSKYMVTDITADEVSYLAPQMLDYSFDGSRIYSLSGETVMGEKFEEFYADDQAIYELILKVFYEEQTDK